MLGLPNPYLIVGAVAAGLAYSGAIYTKGRVDGRASVLTQLADDRVTIMKNNQEITNEVLNADDQLLCDYLGGCSDGMRQEADSDESVQRPDHHPEGPATRERIVNP